ncbi:MAG: TrkH family potassium uptake protein [Bacteroidales bacterium]|jgi:trk system potassium uptake protein TrkH|nr:TrkH family potassium uptake protein [Bacteroidales bacterium]
MRLINPVNIIRILSTIMLIEAVSFLACLPVSLIYNDPAEPFLWSSLVTGSLYLLMRGISRNSVTDQISNRDTFLIVTLAWIIISIAGSLPYLFSKTIPSFINALFESTSGFTTTGASILTDVESLPHSILFWRSLTHWIGGIGIIVLVILILPSLKIAGYHLFSLESSVKEKIYPKIKGVANRIMIIYLGITILEIIFLLLGGMNPFDSICHSFGTIATGGFSTKNSSIADYSPYIQYVIAIFMFLSATSYVVYYYLLSGNFSKVLKNEEFWFYLFIVTASVSFVTVTLYLNTDRNLELSFRHAFFQVISQISCTGFATTDYMAFPPIGWFFMFLIMFLGGSTGSTTGGIKMARHLISLKNLRNTFIKLHHPNAVIPIRLNDQTVPDNTVNQMIVFISLYILIFLAGNLLMQISGISIIEASGAAATSLAGIGPGLGASGNMGNYAHFNAVAKLIMMILMIIGRLEIFTIITLFTRTFRRN